MTLHASTFIMMIKINHSAYIPTFLTSIHIHNKKTNIVVIYTKLNQIQINKSNKNNKIYNIPCDK